MNWTAEIPDELKAYATAVIGNITPETCAQCPRLEWLQTWSAGVDKYQRPGVLHPGSMLTNATGAYGQSVSEHMFAMMWAIMKNLHIYAVGNPNAAWQDAGDISKVATSLLADTRLWGEDLTKVAGLAEQTAAALARIKAVGVKAAMAEM